MTARRVLIDGFFLGKPYGFGRFVFELCRALGRARTDLEFVVAVPARVDGALLADYRNVSWRRMPNANFTVWEQVLVPNLARTLACDVIHFPYNTRALFARGVPTVTTVHDVLFLTSEVPPVNFKDAVAAWYAKHVFRHGTRRSDRVVSVSETTRQSLAAMGIESRTVYNTIDGFLTDCAPNRSHDRPPPGEAAGERPYILHRGGYLPHRNTGRIIDAFREAQRSLPGIGLKVIGAPEGAAKWGTRADEAIEFLPRLSDRDLAALYAGSACVVAASLHEGFGLPIIEGFGFAAPVVTSDVDPMREVAGDAALLVDPRSVSGIAAAMVSVVSDAALAQSMVAKGRERLKLFGSERVAEQMIEVYRS